MKKVILIFIITSLILPCLISCGNVHPYTLIREHYADNRIISEIFYNKANNQTWVYEYKYNDYGILTDIVITIYDAEGNIIEYDHKIVIPEDSSELPLQEETCKPSEPIKTPQILLNEKGVKITLQSVERDEFWSSLNFTLLIENNSNKSVYIRTADEYVDNFTLDMSLYFGTSSSLDAGRKEITTMNLFDTELQDLGISNPSVIEFQIEVYFAQENSEEEWFEHDPDIIQKITFNLN